MFFSNSKTIKCINSLARTLFLSKYKKKGREREASKMSSYNLHPNQK